MQLYPYQTAGVSFLVNHPRAYLADEMGLGKTVQACYAAGITANVDPDDGLAPVVICPASVIPVWREHLARFSIPGAVLSYERMVQRPRDARDARFFIFDEAHYLKTPDSKRTKVALDITYGAERIWMLSGTPMPNNPAELWAPMRILRPNLLLAKPWESYPAWLSYFCQYEATRYGIKVTGAKNTEILRALLKPVMYRRRLVDVAIDLPPLRIHTQWVPSDVDLDVGDVTAEQMLAFPSSDPHVMRLRRRLGEWKAQPIAAQLLDELRSDPGLKLVVYAHHTDVIATLRQSLSVFGVVVIEGKTSEINRERAVSAFNHDPAVRVFIGQNTAAGTGITLTGGHEIVLVEPAWSPEDNMQIIKRVHRIGQTRPVRARMFAVEDSLDEALVRIIARKTRLIGAIID